MCGICLRIQEGIQGGYQILYATIFQHFMCIIIKICIFWMLKWHTVYWHSCFWDAYIFYVHNLSINKTTFWEQVCIIWFFMLIYTYIYWNKATFKCNVGGCHVQADSNWLLISWYSTATSEQVRTPFRRLVRKPHCACWWWGGSLWRTASSVRLPACHDSREWNNLNDLP